MRELRDRVAVVTGAASGIGLALAERFAAEGMTIVMADVEAPALAAAADSLRRTAPAVLASVVDVARPDDVERLAREAYAAFGAAHVLCNNAGVAVLGAVHEHSLADWQWVMGVNFWGVVYGLQAFVPHMLAHGESGHIVNTASLAGLMPGGGTYGISKHAVLALTEGLHRDLKTRNANISASVLCPGFVNTQIFDAERNRPAELKAGTAPELAAGMREVGRAMLAQGKAPAEVADIVFESIAADRFYILPHPAWDPIVRARVEHVLQRGAPLTMDMEDMARRRAAGEKF